MALGLEVVEGLETFGGVGNVKRGLDKDETLKGLLFDYRRNSDHNTHTKVGIKMWAKMAIQVRPKGFAMFEPTCASWLRYLSVSTSKRNQALGE